MREAFELQVNKFTRGQKLDLTKHHDSRYGTYLFDSTECAYRAWQAAIAHQKQDVNSALEEAAKICEGLISKPSKHESVQIQNEAFEIAATEIRALIK